jgi:hypothetical protein
MTNPVSSEHINGHDVAPHLSEITQGVCLHGRMTEQQPTAVVEDLNRLRLALDTGDER